MTDMPCKKTVYIRTDGNQTIGTGHVMRCLSIAQQIKELGVKTVFITSDDAVSEFITGKGFENICLNTQWNKLENEIEIMKDIINEAHLRCDLSAMVVDSYYITDRYLRELKCHMNSWEDTKGRLFYIDDLNSMHYPVDAIINYNIYGSEFGYNEGDYSKLYLGTRYVPLRDEFVAMPERSYKGVNNILITSGGTDEYNAIGKVLDTFIKFKDFDEYEYYCVLGRFNKNIDVLKKNFECKDNVHFLCNISNMSHYMSICDVAITAGGSTCYELCSCGIPSIVYTFVDNQLDIAKTFDEQEIIPWIGDIRDDVDECMNKLMNELNLLKDENTWENRSRRMQTVVDGKGAERLAKVLTEGNKHKEEC